jgi:6-phosphogluconolactonase (cycloisomerase 2 family)
MIRQLIMAVTILLIVNLLIPNAAGVYPRNQSPIGSDEPERFARSLYVMNSGEDVVPRGQGSTISRFTIETEGRLTLAEAIPACGGANRLVFTPDLRFAYLACIYDGQIAAYRVAGDGALTNISQVAFPGAFGIAIAPNGRTLYVSSADDSTLAAFRVGAKGQLTLLNSLDSGGSTPGAITRGLAVTPDGRFVYVGHGVPMGNDDNVLTGFALDADGLLQGQVAEVPNGASGLDIVITPDGRFLYVTAGASNRVFGYEIGADGSLAAVPGQSFPSGGVTGGVAMSPDGRRIFAAALGTVVRGSPGEVTGWDIGADGALTEVERLVTEGDALGIQFAPDGRHLYVGDFFFDKVTGFRVSVGGKLTEIQTVDSGGPDPHWIAVLPNRGPVAAFTARPRSTGHASSFDGGASADRDGQVARYDWDFGDGTSLPDGGPKPQHTYQVPGTYRVRLTVTDNERCSTRLIYTGQMPLCLGSSAAITTRTLTVGW